MEASEQMQSLSRGEPFVNRHPLSKLKRTPRALASICTLAIHRNQLCFQLLGIRHVVAKKPVSGLRRSHFGRRLG